MKMTLGEPDMLYRDEGARGRGEGRKEKEVKEGASKGSKTREKC